MDPERNLQGGTMKANDRTLRPTIALIAHDGKKAELVSFVKDHLDFLRQYHLIATGNTGRLVGDAQIASEVATGRCQAVIFLRDPLGMHPHDPDISTLMRICDVHNIPLATNPATARLIVQGLIKEKQKKRKRS
jgi:methylglyoxal synthase